MRFTNQLLVTIIIIFSQIFFTDAESSFNRSSFICDSGMCLPKNYRTHEAPRKEMAIEMHLQRENPIKVEEVNDFKHELTIDMMLLIKWNDPELKLSEPTQLANLPTKIVNLLWKPVFFVPRVKSTTIKSFNSDLAGFFVSNHTGNLTINHWIHSTPIFWCEMNFDAYPLDKHVSIITIIFTFKLESTYHDPGK